MSDLNEKGKLPDAGDNPSFRVVVTVLIVESFKLVRRGVVVDMSERKLMLLNARLDSNRFAVRSLGEKKEVCCTDKEQGLWFSEAQDHADLLSACH